LIAVAPYVSWQQIYNIKSERAIAEAGPATAMFATCFLLSIPLSVISQIRIAYQEGFYNYIWQSLGGLLGLLALVLLVQIRAGLPWLILALVGAPLVMTVLNGWHLFIFTRPWLIPSWQSIDKAIAYYMLQRGGLFLILQIGGTIGYQTDNLVIAQFLGADQVARYAIPLKLFAVVPTLLSFFLAPAWPAYREALSRHDIAWVKRTLWRSMFISFVVSLPLIGALVIFGRSIVNVWAGEGVMPSDILLMGFGLWALSTSVSGPLAMFFNGADVIGFQVKTSLVMAAVNLALSITLVIFIGLPGPIYGTLIAQIVSILIPSVLWLPHLLRRLENGARVVAFDTKQEL